MSFSEKIDKLLVDNNIKNLRQLAKEIDIPYTTLWDYYSNPVRLKKANLYYIKKIANKLGCTIDYLAYEDLTEKNQVKMNGYDLFDINEESLQKNSINIKNNNISEIEKNHLNDLSVLDNVLYSKKDKIDSVKNLPIEKQKIIANAVESVLDMIDDENSN